MSRFSAFPSPMDSDVLWTVKTGNGGEIKAKKSPRSRVTAHNLKKNLFFVKSQVEAGGDHEGLVRLSASPVRKEEGGDLVHAVELKIDGDTGWVFNFPYKIGRFRFFFIKKFQKL